MRLYSVILLIFVLFFVGCGPAIDSPKIYDNKTIKFSYPGNWKISDLGTKIMIREKRFLGIFDGDTTLNLSLETEVSLPPKYEQIREVQTTILDKVVKGELSFDWAEGDFQTRYLVEKGDRSVRVVVDGNEKTLQNSEPGVRQVLESLEFL